MRINRAIIKIESPNLKSWPLAWFLLTLSACGQDPSFLDIKQGEGDQSQVGEVTDKSHVNSENQTASQGNGAIDGFGPSRGGVVGDITGSGPGGSQNGGSSSSGGASSGNGNNSAGNGSGNSGGGSSTTPQNIDPNQIQIPGLPQGDVPQVRKCLAKFGNLPFGSTITDVKKMIGINIGGFGLPVNDTEVTDHPQLVVIYAGVNVSTNVTYNLLNPNAYYCMIVNVNVQSTVNINLHCNARLADNLIDVNVGSTQNSSAATIGVNVNSSVTVNNITPEGDECIR